MQKAKLTPTQKLKAEITALKQDIHTLVMGKSYLERKECELKWKIIFKNEAMAMWGSSNIGLPGLGKINLRNGILSKSDKGKNKISNLKYIETDNKAASYFIKKSKRKI